MSHEWQSIFRNCCPCKGQGWNQWNELCYEDVSCKYMEYRLTHYKLKQGTGRRNKGLNVFVESLNLAQLFIIWSIGMDLKKVMSFFLFWNFWKQLQPLLQYFKANIIYCFTLDWSFFFYSNLTLTYKIMLKHSRKVSLFCTLVKIPDYLILVPS